jgi:hypothetical protein
MKLMSRRMLSQLGALQSSVLELAAHRSAALRLLRASRSAATAEAQREFWLEFSWLDQEYRAAVRRLAVFCGEYRGGGNWSAVG